MNASNVKASLAEGEWEGEGELWLDPDGDEVTEVFCAASSTPSAIEYKWFYDDEQHRGRIRWSEDGGRFQDTLHLPKETPCRRAEGSDAVAVLRCDAGQDDEEWEIKVSLRPEGQLVIQLTRIPAEDEREPVARLVFESADDE